MQNTETKILAIVAHPDDEVLGCGGYLHKMSQTGVPVEVAFMAPATTARSGKIEIDDSLNQAKEAASILGIDIASVCNYADCQMDAIPFLQVVQSVERAIYHSKPTIVLTHHPGCLNIDHQVTGKAVLTACRPFAFPRVRQVLFFATPSSTEWGHHQLSPAWQPNLFVQLSEENVTAKVRALVAYETEVKQAPHPRSESLIWVNAQQVGSVFGCRYAEAFMAARLELNY